MKLDRAVKPISYLKAHAATVIREVAESRTPYVITQRGEAKAVVMDVESYDQLRESLALLKILAMGEHGGDKGHKRPARAAISDLRRQLRSDYA